MLRSFLSLHSFHISLLKKLTNVRCFISAFQVQRFSSHFTPIRELACITHIWSTCLRYYHILSRPSSDSSCGEPKINRTKSDATWIISGISRMGGVNSVSKLPNSARHHSALDKSVVTDISQRSTSVAHFHSGLRATVPHDVLWKPKNTVWLSSDLSKQFFLSCFFLGKKIDKLNFLDIRKKIAINSSNTWGDLGEMNLFMKFNKKLKLYTLVKFFARISQTKENLFANLHSQGYY